jgi:hypothetical protein
MKKLFVILMTLLLVVAAGCIDIYLPGQGPNPVPGQTPAPTIVPTDQKPSAYIDSIVPATIVQGSPVAFNGHGTDVDGTITGYEWKSSLDGVLSTAQSFVTASLNVGVHTIYFRVKDNSGQWSDPVSGIVTVNPNVAKPSILSFSANPQSVNAGSASVLSWNVSGATQVVIDNGIGPVATSGSRTVTPVMSTMYTLTATNQGGSVSAVTTVTVTQISFPPVIPYPPYPVYGNPVINYFTARYIGGSSWELRWSVSNATSIRIDPEIGNVSEVGSTIVTAVMPRSYTMTATNDWGWSRYYVTLGYQY